ncbi:MAG: signal peptidase I, partial [Rhodobacteraceae bacterium]|nr:signal peptidase I [Paracoccaceae bacterium]
FKHPVTGDDFIKRLIGLPGDTVQMRAGQGVLNGEVLTQEPAVNFEEVFDRQGPAGGLPRCSNMPLRVGDICLKERRTETLPGGRSYTVLDIDSVFAENTPLFTVPEGHYFFIGDNRDNSQDSRFPQTVGGVGFVPFENLVGRADRVIFSSAGRSMLAFWTWRSDRFFERLE